MNPATITVNAPAEMVAAAMRGGNVVQETFGDTAERCRFSFIDAPGGRGTEIHASCDGLDQKAIKAALRKCRALLEAGEMPTGDRRR